MKPNNSLDKAALIIVIICAVLCVAYFPFLSDIIAIQWSGCDVSNKANKLLIFVLPLLSFGLYLARTTLVSVFLAKRGVLHKKEILISYITLLLEILLLSGVVSIILFDAGIPLAVGPIIILEIIIGALLGFIIIRENP